MLVRHSSAAYVISFGHAWQHLELKWLELDFGRRVVLNSVPRNKIIEVSSQQIIAKKHLARERAPRATDVAEFGLEYDRDVVAALEGSPSEQVFGKTVRGSVSLRLSIHSPSLPDVLNRAAVHFGSTAYKRRWPGIDNVSPISEDGLITQLDSLLDADIISGKAKSQALLRPLLCVVISRKLIAVPSGHTLPDKHAPRICFIRRGKLFSARGRKHHRLQKRRLLPFIFSMRRNRRSRKRKSPK